MVRNRPVGAHSIPYVHVNHLLTKPMPQLVLLRGPLSPCIRVLLGRGRSAQHTVGSLDKPDVAGGGRRHGVVVQLTVSASYLLERQL